MESIYLDHNATTPTRPEVVEVMARCYAEIGANPASPHRPGRQARRRLEDAREQIAAILGVDLSAPRRDRLILTSGGTEANNLALLGIARAAADAISSSHERSETASCALRSGETSRAAPPPQIVISAGEHQSVIDPAEHLLEQGWRLDTLGLTRDGVVRVDQLPPLLGPPTRLVSVVLGNHETGVLQPVAALADICNRAGVPLHTDAAQVVGKLPVDFSALGVAAMSIAAHKFGGPLGIGALIVRKDVPLAPLMFGGHQQGGIRPGTESPALAAGMAAALQLWQREREQLARRLQQLRDRFERLLRHAIPELVIHGAAAERLPQTSSVAFPGHEAWTLLASLDLAGVACSIGSACASGSAELSPTLRGMDLPKELVAASLRFSLGAAATESEIDEAVRRIAKTVLDLPNGERRCNS